jgi:hypothetical protein
MTGLRFRETLSGRVALRATQPVDGYASVGAFAASMRAEIEIDDVAYFLAGTTHEARLRAELVIPVLGGRFVSKDGTFVLFKREMPPDGRWIQQMIYTATFVNDDRVFKLSARKILRPGWRLWRDTTTVHVKLEDLSGDDDRTRPRVLAGLVKISPWSFLVQLTTMQGFGARSSWLARQWAVLTYSAFFARGLVKVYLLRRSW